MRGRKAGEYRKNNATDQVKGKMGTKRFVPEVNTQAAITLDFEVQDWWGEDHDRFKKEIQGYLDRGWSRQVTKEGEGGRTLRVLLLPPPEKDTNTDG